ncbi:MAG: HAMP domain-containing sensor histidine kinase [Eubacteriales bacterium]|nr:HAMP domain-containing sensor histidine kinase [Eubacteriales bacterium]
MKNKKKNYDFKLKNVRFIASAIVFCIELVTTLITVGLYYLLLFFRLMPEGTIISVWMPVIIFASCNLVGAVVASIFSSQILKPIGETIDALQKVAKGDFDIRLETETGNSRTKQLKQSLNETAKELGSIEVMRNDFTNIISHEFKTPVSSIMGYAQRVKSAELDEKEKSECIDTIIDESKKLSSMTNNILLLTKIENTGIVPDKKEFSLDEQIRNCVALLQNDWLSKNIIPNGDLEEINYVGNEELISHIWLNLIQNAIKYTDENGKIDVKLFEKDGNIAVEISDNGKGMSEEEQKHIFDKFYQADGNHSIGGNGLGLPIAKKIAQMHGGDITVLSKLGVGTSFTVTLPKNQH